MFYGREEARKSLLEYWDLTAKPSPKERLLPAHWPLTRSETNKVTSSGDLKTAFSFFFASAFTITSIFLPKPWFNLSSSASQSHS
ncbi:hypothetical protein RJT34_23925 [Clitoria ternatea]|uniref:Uncharacterized protein n=1 Tax=Clitoria ternatea TaxID=43366 RepID=A0AAN9FPR8_CLITE